MPPPLKKKPSKLLSKAGSIGSKLVRNASHYLWKKNDAKLETASTAVPTQLFDPEAGGSAAIDWTASSIPNVDDADANAQMIETKAELIRKESENWTGTQRVTSAAFEERYFTREVLGEGGFGTVFRVLRCDDGTEFAAKQIAHHGSDARWKEAQQEASTWAKISSPYHPAILPLVEVFEVEGATMHLVTELMPCAELTDAVFYVSMSEQACRLIIVQIASAIAHLHLHHMMAHRDVKPANVLCRFADPTMIGSCKLADFGLCKPFEKLLEPAYTDVCGTVDYLAPELAIGLVSGDEAVPVSYGASVDCWALGVIAYELLHGHPPYYNHGQSDDEILRSIVKHDLPWPKASFGGVSSAGCNAIRRLLESDPRRRLTIDDALLHEWLQPVVDEQLRVQMAASVQSEVVQRRIERRRDRLRSAGLKIVAMQRISRASEGNNGSKKKAKAPAVASEANKKRVVGQKAKASGKRAEGGRAVMPPPKPLARAISSVRSPGKPKRAPEAAASTLWPAPSQGSPGEADVLVTTDAMEHFTGSEGLYSPSKTKSPNRVKPYSK